MKYSKNIFSMIVAATIMAACIEDSSQSVSSGSEISFSIEPAAQTRTAEAPADVESKMAVCQGDTFYLKTEVRQMDEMPATTTTTRGATKVASDLQSDGFVVSAYNTSDGTTRGTSYFEFLTATYADSKFTPQDAGIAKYWPKGKLMFYAYYPKYTASNGITQGTDATTLTYSVPSSPANHPDLMTAKQTNQQYTSGGTGTASLTFNHALCAIQFQTGDDIGGGTINSITFHNVYTSGTYNLDTNTWGSTTTDNISFTGLNVATTEGTSGTPILTGNNTLMMIPQDFTDDDDADITISFTDASSVSHTLTHKLKDTEWTAGTCIIYSVTTSGLFIRNNPLWWLAEYNMAQNKTSFVASHSTSSQYCFTFADAATESIDGYHLPIFDEQISIVPMNNTSTSSDGTNIFTISNTDATSPYEFSEQPCNVGGNTVAASTSYMYKVSSNEVYAVRFVGTDYASAWHYKYANQTIGSETVKGLLVESYLVNATSVTQAKSVLQTLASSTVWEAGGYNASSTKANLRPTDTSSKTNSYCQRFLPACGYCTSGTGESNGAQGANGNYWSATAKDESVGWRWHFDGSSLYEGTYTRLRGYSVRLFRDH